MNHGAAVTWAIAIIVVVRDLKVRYDLNILAIAARSEITNQPTQVPGVVARDVCFFNVSNTCSIYNKSNDSQ